ncbi:MAG: response regulator transcription factor [Oscillospiraceae bacterium]|nr:response regulator transcription factor [Oscillospiraceae bacterium]
MDNIRLLIAENRNGILKSIYDSFVSEGFAVDEATDGIMAIKLFRRNDYAIIVIDSNLPELDSYNVCYQIRKISDVPVIVIGDKTDENTILQFYNIGIDDYLSKPFYLSELIAKIRVLLRRTKGLKSATPRVICCNEIHIDTVSRMVYIEDREIRLTPKEYDLLLFLSQNPNRALSREVLLNEVWGIDFAGSDRTVDTHIKTLRERIKPYHGCIATVWGYGYKLEI